MPVVQSVLHFWTLLNTHRRTLYAVKYSTFFPECSLQLATGAQCSQDKSKAVLPEVLSLPLTHRVIDLAPINLNNVLPSSFDSLFLFQYESALCLLSSFSLHRSILFRLFLLLSFSYICTRFSLLCRVTFRLPEYHHQHY